MKHIEYSDIIPSGMSNGKSMLRTYKIPIPRNKVTGRYQAYKNRFRKITVGEYTINIKIY